MNIFFVSTIISLVLTYVERVEFVSRFITEGSGGEEPGKRNSLCPSVQNVQKFKCMFLSSGT